MTLEEAIKHCEEKAKELRQSAGRFSYPDKAGTTKESADCLECAKEHEQLAEWLKEYKALKERPQGEWLEKEVPIYYTDDEVETVYICPKCGYENFEKSNFCPNCGAKMEGGEKND